MTSLLREIPYNDPLKIVEQKTIIDNAIEQNKERPGLVLKKE